MECFAVYFKGRMKNYVLNNQKLTLEDLVFLCRNEIQIKLGATVKKKVDEGAHNVEKLSEGKQVYGINTGFGALANQVIPENKLAELQENLIRSHACGVGEPLDRDIVRGVILLLISSLSKGYSGIQLTTLEALVQIFNKNIIPVVPEKGSVGASGDLVPLAHLALALIGEGEAFWHGKKLKGKEILSGIGLCPVKLKPKEGLALINGTHVLTSLAAFCLWGARNLAKTADIAAAASLEALQGADQIIHPSIHKLKPHPGQLNSASNLRKLIKGSRIIYSPRKRFRVQDVYSLRCSPQVHGASKDAISYAQKVVETEMNSVTDNPLIFSDEKVLYGGNFHGQAIALASDFLGIALAELADISEKRIEQLLNSDLDNLPPFLTEEYGLNSGLMVSQYTAASLVSQNKVLAHPASVDSIPTSAGKEDHVSMATIAAKKALEILYNAQNVIAIELLCAAQALDFHSPLKPGKGVERAYQVIRKHVPPLEKDRILYKDILKTCQLVHDGTILKGVEKAIGPLK